MKFGYTLTRKMHLPAFFFYNCVFGLKEIADYLDIHYTTVIHALLTKGWELTLVALLFYIVVAMTVMAIVFSLIYWIKDQKDGRH
jgi:hypothetical protein